MTDAEVRHRSSGKRRWLIGLVVAGILVVVAYPVWNLWFRPSMRATDAMEQAIQARKAGDFEAAEQLAAQALELDPELEEAAFLAARCAALRSRYEQAIQYLDTLNSKRTETLIAAALQKAEWNLYGLFRITQAERAYRDALRLDPESVAANTGLARLLGICARSREAVPHILRLIQLGEETDLLVLIARERGAINDLELLEASRRRVPDDPAPLVGLAWHADSNGQPDRAIALLEEALALDADYVPAAVALGRRLEQLGRSTELARWRARLPEAALDRAETWLVRARMAEVRQDTSGAIRCYWEAARRSPELRVPQAALATLLKSADMPEAAERFAAHLQSLLDLNAAQDRMFSGQHANIEPALKLAEACEAAGRLWEAYAWCKLAANVDPTHAPARTRLERLETAVDSLPLEQTVAAANVARSLDLSRFPVPDLSETQTPSAAPSADATGFPFAFRDDATATGLRFGYFNGTAGEPTRRMYEFTGGGLGVIDFDRDGWPDVFCTQGRPWPPESPLPAEFEGDQLYRNIAGHRFVAVTELAGIRESDFGQGVAVGDFDADGFPDVFVGNIGANRLWRNNGDGTFSDVTRRAGINDSVWTTSCLFADLNGDGLSDIYAVNYLGGADVFERVCTHADGGTIACVPLYFDSETDRLWLNQGDGQFRDATAELLQPVPDGKGLGVVAWDADGSGQLSLLVANDTTPNLLFVPSETAAAATQSPVQRVERGITAGIAVNAQGKAEGCMGIAVGDIDDDGLQDIYVTNFFQETNTFYRALPGLLFQDATRAVGLAEPTLELLGFGTQFLDVNRDGRLELFVANGHVDDLRRYGRPYAMRPQLFADESGRFREAASAQLGDYFQQQWLGRAAAVLDWNGDGRDDLLVGHLDANVALLTNVTEDCGQFLGLTLCGVQSHRDAAGAVVEFRVSGRTLTRQLVAGGGYQASNQQRLSVGLGDRAVVDELLVRWPSGTVQRFPNVPVSQELILVEGQALRTMPDRPAVPAEAPAGQQSGN